MYEDAFALEEAPNAGLFAVPAFFITFREMLEAAIIISVLLALLDKVELPHLKRYVWLGVGLASILCIVVAVLLVIIVNLAREELLQNNDRAIVDGIISIVAAVLVGVVALSIGNVMALTSKVERKVENALQAQHEAAEEAIGWGMIFFLSFTAVLREGVETILFFVAIGANYPPESLPIPALVGAVVGAILGVLLYNLGGRLAVRVFFKATMVLLVFIGAGIFTNGMHSLQGTGAFGFWGDNDTRNVDRPSQNRELFNISECCGTDNEFWLMMRVLFGYSPNPTGLEIFFYLGYHAVVWTVVLVRYQRAKAGKPPLKKAFKAWIAQKLAKKEEVPKDLQPQQPEI